MFITLMGENEMRSVSLPEKPAGRYTLEGFDDKGRNRTVLLFEPRNNAWVARSTKWAKTVDSLQEAFTNLDTSGNSSFPLSVYDSQGNASTATLLIEPSTSDRTEYHKCLVDGEVSLVFGRSSKSDVQYDREFVSASHAVLSNRGGKWVVEDCDSANGTYVNDKRIAAGGKQALHPGDVIYIVGLRILVGEAFIAMNNPDGAVEVYTDKLSPFILQQVDPLPTAEDWEAEIEEDDDAFFRSPRFKREIKTKEISVDAPPERQQGDATGIVQMIGPALIMGAAALFSGVVMTYNTMQSGGSILTAAPMLVMSVSMILGMALFPIIARRSQRKKDQESESLRQERYLRYLADIRDEIAQEGVQQKQILLENHATPEACIDRALNGDRKLWERTADHSDFLELRFGIGSRPLAANINFPEKHFSMADDNLVDAMYDLANAPTDLKDVPITVSLVNNRVSGIIGSRTRVIGLVRNLIAQVTALHSYDEVKLVFLVDEEERAEWDYARFMPHAWSDDQSQRYFACGLQEAQELSIMLEKVIARRLEEGVEADDDGSVAVPHYLVIAASKKIADRCGFISTVLNGADGGAFSIIALYDSLENIPKESTVVISVEGGAARIFDKNDTSGDEIEFVPDNPVSIERIGAMTVTLANTFMNQLSKHFELPSVLTFMQMYKAGMIEHLDILTRWKENDPTISLAVPVGVDENGDPFNLDLHEKIHGPHGLVAGMTGSGKSEFIITLILSLAVNYSPDEIAFVLIDYKGGGLANAFDNERMRLPHLAGTITNLDGAAINRSLVSIEAELKRRQRVFNEARASTNEGTMDIYKYQRLYRQGRVDEPMPHLLIISDEFAELKMQQPEFMDQLVSTARIGRSLGVHLILATQKPSGVVNDQIWSNAKFKVCLKVQDRADSMDMIRRPEAAELVDTGRFYLQVGFNEFFALGQSAWCGAPYQPSEHVREERDESVAIIDDLGGVLREARPARKADGSEGKQIVRIIEHIDATAKNIDAIARPLWLEPIPELIYVDDLIEKYQYTAPHEGVIEAIVGEYDDPAHQQQGLLSINFAETGNLVVYGASGSGKSMLVSSAVFSLVRQYSPDEVNAYLVDLGTESLKAFARAPHVGDVVVANDADKVINLFRMLEDELSSRRALFAEAGGDYTSYVRGASADESVPAIVIAIEGIAAFFELFENLRDSLTRLTRDSAKFGIYFIVTAESSSAIGFRLAQNFGQSLVLRMNDASEYTSILGNSQSLLLSKSYGIGFVALGEVLEFQTAHALRSDEVSTAEAIRSFCAWSYSGYDGFRARPIPTLPEVVTPEAMLGYEVAGGVLPFGVDEALLAPVGINVLSEQATIVSSEDAASLESFSLGLCRYLAQREFASFAILDAGAVMEERLYEGAREFACVGVEAVASELLGFASDKQQPDLVVLLGLGRLMEGVEFDERRAIESYFEKLGKQDASFVVLGTAQELATFRFDPWFSSLMGSNGVWLGSGITDQSLVKLAGFSAELMRPVADGFGYVIQRGNPVLCKMLTGDSSAVDG